MNRQLHAGVLRAARLEVAPHIPELAPQLPDNPDIVRAALCDAIGRLGVNPTVVAANNLNKAERSTYVAFLAAEQKKEIIEGSGQSARFMDVDDIIGDRGV